MLNVEKHKQPNHSIFRSHSIAEHTWMLFFRKASVFRILKRCCISFVMMASMRPLYISAFVAQVPHFRKTAISNIVNKCRFLFALSILEA